MAQIRDILGIWYDLESATGAVFQDDMGNWFTVGGGGSGGGAAGSGTFSAANQGLAFGGRLTLTTLTPVLTTTVSAADAVYYTPYAGSMAGNRIAIYDGTILQPYAFDELINVMTDGAGTTGGPAAAANSSVYDLYVWNNAGMLALTRSPAWASAISRGTGAASAEQSAAIPGILTNAVAITNGPAAQRGTYVGTIATNGTATLDWIFGSIAAGWGMASHRVWNMHNRVMVGGFLADSTDSWTYQIATIRAANANATARVNTVFGLSEDGVIINGAARVLAGANTVGIVGVGLDSTTTCAQSISWGSLVGAGASMLPYFYSGFPGIGSHFLSSNEATGNTTNAVTFYGDAGFPSLIQSGMHYSMRM
jgi:hypothetical protein